MANQSIAMYLKNDIKLCEINNKKMDCFGQSRTVAYLTETIQVLYDEILISEIHSRDTGYKNSIIKGWS